MTSRISTLAAHLSPQHCIAGGHTSTPSGRLKGKVAIVTGAASGIGRATALMFAKQSCKVYAADYDADGVTETVKQITDQGGVAIACEIDVTDEEANEQLVNDCVKAFGGLHIYFANAGVMGSTQPFWELDTEDWLDVLKVNTVGVAMGFKFAARYMKDNGVTDGSLIATSSVAGIRSGAGGTEYSASKAAVMSMVMTCANQLGGTGIRVNAICPGLIETGMTGMMFDMARTRGTEKKIGQLNPSRRGGVPVEIANMALFLASDEASYVNGQSIAVCGGLSSSHPVVPGKLA